MMDELTALTMARVGLGRTGASMPLNEVLRLGEAHAAARDAVHHRLDTAEIGRQLDALRLPWVEVASAARDRREYLGRPDLGRRLKEPSRERLQAAVECDLAVVVADGLSALAVTRHAVPLLATVLPMLDGWTLAPVAVATQARVALGDEIGERLRARLCVVLIGERPGLSSPDSLGVYLTFAPRKGRTDAERNCISNVRPEGLPYAEAAVRLAYLLKESRHRKLSGVTLKDESGALLEGKGNPLLEAKSDVALGRAAAEQPLAR